MKKNIHEEAGLLTMENVNDISFIECKEDNKITTLYFEGDGNPETIILEIEDCPHLCTLRIINANILLRGIFTMNLSIEMLNSTLLIRNNDHFNNSHPITFKGMNAYVKDERTKSEFSLSCPLYTNIPKWMTWIMTDEQRA